MTSRSTEPPSSTPPSADIAESTVPISPPHDSISSDTLSCLSELSSETVGIDWTEQKYTAQDVAHVSLVLAGAKPAANISFAVEDFSDINNTTACRFSKTVNLPSRIQAKTWDDFPPMASATTVQLTLASDKDSLARFEETKEKLPLSRRCGELYGYPQEAVDWFVDTEFGRTNEYRAYLSELISQGEFSRDQARFLGFVPYLPPPEQSSFEDAIEMGKRYYSVCVSAADEWGVPSLVDVANRVCEREEEFLLQE